MRSSALGKRLQRLREFAGLDRSALAALAGLAPPHVGMIERGVVQAPSTKTISALAEVLGAPLDYLLLGAGEEPAPEHVRASVARARQSASARESAA